MKKIDFTEQLDKVIEAANKAGADTNVLYLTTLDRYKTQINIMEKLKVSIAQDGPTVTKEYVKSPGGIAFRFYGRRLRKRPSVSPDEEEAPRGTERLWMAGNPF